MSARYSKSFKIQAVKEVIENKKSAAQVAREVGVNPNTMRQWLKQYKKDEKDPFVGSGNLHEKDKRIRDLERKIKDLEEENEILKKLRPSLRRTEKNEVRIY